MLKCDYKTFCGTALSLLMACASTSGTKTETQEEKPATYSAETSAPLAFESVKSEPVSTAPISKPNGEKKNFDSLDEAIKSQSDEKIHKAATAALLQNPQDGRALNALALSHYKKGRLTSAKYLLGKALQVQAKAEVYNNLGVVHLALGESREALRAFRQALSLDPQNGPAAANAGAIFLDNKDYNKAVVALETAYQAGLRDSKILNNYAVALVGTGKPTLAEAQYEKALKDQPSNKDILFNYAVLLVDHLKKYREGSDVINRLKFVGLSPEQKSRIKNLENTARIGLQ